VVEGLLLFAVFRYQRRPAAGEPPQIQGNAPRGAAWTAVPAIILVVLLVTLRTMAADAVLGPQGLAQGDLRIHVIGHQWWWEVRYLANQVTTANEIRIPIGEPVTVDITSIDVIHSFWVPQLQGKIDVIPGHTNQTWLQSDQPGVYRGQCSGFCSLQHARMAFRVVADTPDQFNAWLSGQRGAATPANDPLAHRGVRHSLVSVTSPATRSAGPKLALRAARDRISPTSPATTRTPPARCAIRRATWPGGSPARSRSAGQRHAQSASERRRPAGAAGVTGGAALMAAIAELPLTTRSALNSLVAAIGAWLDTVDHKLIGLS
jgi:cytochrome c oxidase subunit II